MKPGNLPKPKDTVILTLLPFRFVQSLNFGFASCFLGFSPHSVHHTIGAIMSPGTTIPIASLMFYLWGWLCQASHQAHLVRFFWCSTSTTPFPKKIGAVYEMQIKSWMHWFANLFQSAFNCVRSKYKMFNVVVFMQIFTLTAITRSEKLGTGGLGGLAHV